jgi:DNA-binding NtrC family response regulator
MARPRPNVLVVDDDAATRDGLTALLESWGYQALAVSNGQAALQRCNHDLPHAIVSDLMMPGMTGLQFIEALHERVHQVAIIMLTGQATIETAVQAIKLGAYDYLPKPLESARLRAVLEKGLKQVGFAREANVLRQKLESPLGSYGELIGKSAEMAAEVQVKVLRVLEEGQVRRIGATTSIPVAARVVAARNRQPASAVKEGKLRQDLFYRLKIFNLSLPPLRERGDDIPLLAR